MAGKVAGDPPVLSVLYADDETILLDSLKASLERNPRFFVDIAHSAEEALERLTSSARYDAVISDYQMPGMSGIELLRKLRTAGNTVPFILFTGRGREDVVVEAYNAGADSYLIKGGNPRFMFMDLARTIERLVAGRKMEQELLFKNTLLAMQQEVTLDGIVVVDAGGTVLSVNRQFLDLWGLGPEATRGRSWDDLRADLAAKVLDAGRLFPDPAGTGASARGIFRGEISLKNDRSFDCYSAPLAGSSGQVMGRVWYFRDVTEQKQSREALVAARDSLEENVRERTRELTVANLTLREEIDRRIEAEASISASLQEKELLLREIHHRVKNNLQVIISLLNLQSRYIHDEHVLAAIRESQSRVRAIAIVHERLYRSTNISAINLGNYLKYLAESLLKFYSVDPGRIRLTVNADGVEMGIDQAVPLGIIINELVSNAIKYAFPDSRQGCLGISAMRDGRLIVMTIEDDGVGLPAGLDWRCADSLGLQLVINLTDQLDGTIDLLPGQGVRYRLAMPVRPAGSERK